MTDPRLLSLLHFADSAFPTGGYAHSFGLETYCQAGLVRGREDLERFLVAEIEGVAGPCDGAAALRLLSMGQMEGQRVLWTLHPVIERVAQEAAARDAGDLWSFAPGIEIAGIRHAALEMRLFRS